jgi:hypothetical protein
MARHVTLGFLIAGVSLLLLRAAMSQSAMQPLRLGDAFPQFSGQTITGETVELPGATSGKVALVVFSFSRAAGKDARSWNEHLFKDFSNSNFVTVPGYQIIELESVPKPFRAVAVASMRSAMPHAVQDRTILVYQDEALWKQRLGANDDAHAYIILLGADGRIRWSNSASYSDSGYEQLKSAIEAQLQAHQHD